MLEVPQALLDERRAKGLDKSDEMWEGALHMVPPPSLGHQRPGPELFLVLGPLAKARGLVPLYDPASLVLEILSPNDETWYAEVGVGEVLVEPFANRDGRMEPVDPVHVQALDVGADTIDGVLARL